MPPDPDFLNISFIFQPVIAFRHVPLDVCCFLTTSSYFNILKEDISS